MNISRYKTYCLECKTLISDIQKSFIIDNSRPQSFCSEKCVEKFYQNEIHDFQEQEKELRREFQIFEIHSVDEDTLRNYRQESLLDPDEIWEDSNPINEKYYYLLKSYPYEDSILTNITICKMFNEKPSFIFHSFFTSSTDLINSYKLGKKVKGLEEGEKGYQKEQFVLPQEILDEIAVRKNECFAQMLVHRKETDISFETFPLYEQFIKKTLDDPDEIYEEIVDGYTIHTMFKTNFYENKAFSHYVIGMKVMNGKEEVLLPIFSFPTIDEELLAIYNQGKRIFKKAIN